MTNSYDDTWLRQKLKGLPFSACITDPNQTDNPIVYVNDLFCEQTGFAQSEIIGKNCRFLQCDESDPAEVARIRKALDARQEVAADLLNRRADGSTFWNRLSIKPIFDEANQLQRFMAVQIVLKDNPYETIVETKRRSDTALSELHHRLKNHLALMHSSVRLQIRESGESEGLVGVLNRIQSLQTLYSSMKQGIEAPAGMNDVDLFAHLGSICEAIIGLDDTVTFAEDTPTEPLQMSIDTATQLGMMVAELVTNSMQHAFDDNGGQIRLIGRISAETLTIRIEDDGKGVASEQQDKLGSGLGGKILQQIAKSLSAKLDFKPLPRGMAASLTLPYTPLGAEAPRALTFAPADERGANLET